MGVCEVRGNDYDKTMQVTAGGQTHVLDSFECAIHALAPRRAYCQCTIVGHRIETGSAIYRCAHCAHVAGSARQSTTCRAGKAGAAGGRCGFSPPFRRVAS